MWPCGYVVKWIPLPLNIPTPIPALVHFMSQACLLPPHGIRPPCGMGWGICQSFFADNLKTGKPISSVYIFLFRKYQ